MSIEDNRSIVYATAVEYGVSPTLMWNIAKTETGGKDIINMEGKYEGVMQVQRRTWAGVMGNAPYDTSARGQSKAAALLIRSLQRDLRTSDDNLIYLGYARGGGTAASAQRYMKAGDDFNTAAQKAIREAVRRGAIRQDTKNRKNVTSSFNMTPQQFEDFQVQSYINGANRMSRAGFNGNQFSYQDPNVSNESSDKASSPSDEFFKNIGVCSDNFKAMNTPTVLNGLVKKFHEAKKRQAHV